MRINLILILGIFLISFVSADILSINSYGEEVVISPSQLIEGFHSGDILPAPTIGGTQITRLDDAFLIQICNELNNFFSRYGRNGSVTIFVNNLKNKNISITEYQASLYIYNFDYYCEKFKPLAIAGIKGEKKFHPWIWALLLLIVLMLVLIFVDYYANKKKVLLFLKNKLIGGKNG